MKTYLCKRASEPIVIDGNLDKVAWDLADPVELTRNLDGGVPRFATTTRLLWDDAYLYISFQCVDEEIRASMTQRDDPLWEEEVVEAFINPNGDEIGYLEFEVSPLNTLLDLYVLNRPPYPAHFLFGWNSRGIRHAVRVKGDLQCKDSQDQSWSVEIAMPWEDFVTAAHLPPLPGDRWRINLYRIDHYQGQVELSAWSPTGQATFHVPAQFGELIFSM